MNKRTVRRLEAAKGPLELFWVDFCYRELLGTQGGEILKAIGLHRQLAAFKEGYARVRAIVEERVAKKTPAPPKLKP